MSILKNLALALVAYTLVDIALSKVYDRCELARELIAKHKIQKKDIGDWICLIKHESDFNTSAVGRLNGDGSLDYGLFQISNLFWCNHDSFDGGACGLNCNDLLDDNIKDDVICARRVFRNFAHKGNSGFDAWVAWRAHCDGRNVQSYVEDCNL